MEPQTVGDAAKEIVSNAAKEVSTGVRDNKVATTSLVTFLFAIVLVLLSVFGKLEASQASTVFWSGIVVGVLGAILSTVMQIMTTVRLNPIIENPALDTPSTPTQELPVTNSSIGILPPPTQETLITTVPKDETLTCSADILASLERLYAIKGIKGLNDAVKPHEIYQRLRDDGILKQEDYEKLTGMILEQQGKVQSQTTKP